ncbi:hypothetical protein M422DRAFT_24871 [Sphaerobolus stellatus SS14]|nr:hypothetical protein M422DRAFT_24871 [Sphaerobolus stellatus SS14]
MEDPLQILCPVCQKSFTLNHNLRRHMSRTHTENKSKFICNICNKIQFSRKDSLLRHRRMCFIKATKEATGDFGPASASSASCQTLSRSSYTYPDYSDPIMTIYSDSDTVALGLGNLELTQVGENISFDFFSTDAFGSNFSTINIPGVFNSGSMAGSFGEISLPLNSLPSMMPSFPSSLGDLSLISETPFREEYLTYGIQYHTHNFPLLHISTWHKTYAHPLLKEALVMRGASYLRVTPGQIQLSDDYVLKVLQSDLRDRIFRAFMEISNNDLDLQYELLLAMSLVQGAGYIHKYPTERRITDGYHNMAILMLRHSGVFDHITKWRSIVNLFDFSAVHDLWRQWIRYESMKRLMLSVYVMDTLRPALSNLPPCLLPTELADLGLFLPVDEPLWTASTAEEWLTERKTKDTTDILGASLSCVMAAFLDPTRSIPELNHFSSLVVIHSFQRSLYGYFIASDHEQYRYQLLEALYRWCRGRLRMPRVFDTDGQFLRITISRR